MSRAEFEAYRRAAQEVADDHDHRRDLGTARRLLAGARLSPRERTVADLMAKGRSDAEIARRLRITERTVRVLRHRITQRLKTRGTILS
jgi:DNA-binding CsgD family transcriptional regulator